MGLLSKDTSTTFGGVAGAVVLADVVVVVPVTVAVAVAATVAVPVAADAASPGAACDGEGAAAVIRVVSGRVSQCGPS